MANLNLKNKSALVTGASGAIGESIAKKLSSLGANLVITGTNKKKIDDLKKKLGPNCEGLIADLSKSNYSYETIKDYIFWYKLIGLPNSLFSLMPLLLVIGFYIKSKRNKKIKEQWELEEILEDLEN